ncbi:sigma-70 family RNA polymerase sigma factor [Ktedonosporobacter rubrisoli]|uniref:RNA polymerase sigma factor n=1 Tax=Ktedonosporobacter rubrisoli TaxID=2509675 RepID=A0A4P6JMY6_KTERU|nr:sigma-70 family RNA polymerase sigma factor [Ktedonosporobacter rubrisoli]QBD76657.1 sigma-70 family RNA polymerase sigma factor [Ktedonosporobacter rubrisoli]
MSSRFPHSRANQNQEHFALCTTHTIPQASLTAQLEERIATAYPRLCRLAQATGVPSNAVEDVVQEALVAAWQHLDHLRSPERFDAWLDRICRNAAYQYHRRQPLHEKLFAEHPEGDLALALDSSHSSGCDPAEEYDSQALNALLERALSLLPAEARQILEAHYLVEVPQRELALRLGITISALESRLHRARGSLRQVLCNDLQAEAIDFGLLSAQETLLTWRQTRLWCHLCGQHRLLSAFESCGQGNINFRLRCPQCWPRFGLDALDSNGITHLGEVRSARPALKRTMRSLITHFSQALQMGYETCSCCGSSAQVRIVSPGEGSFPLPQKFWLRSDCPICGPRLNTLDDVVCWSNPSLQKFITVYPRHITEPDAVVNYAGQEVIRFSFISVTSTARLRVLVQRETLQVLTAFQE